MHAAQKPLRTGSDMKRDLCIYMLMVMKYERVKLISKFAEIARPLALLKLYPLISERCKQSDIDRAHQGRSC